MDEFNGDDLQEEMIRYQTWVGSLRHDAQQAYESLYHYWFNNQVMNGVIVDAAKQEAIAQVEREFGLLPGSFKPTVILDSVDDFLAF